MPVLVTGATGFVGAHVTRALVERGEDVRAGYRNPIACRASATSTSSPSRARSSTSRRCARRCAAATPSSTSPASSPPSRSRRCGSSTSAGRSWPSRPPRWRTSSASCSPRRSPPSAPPTAARPTRRTRTPRTASGSSTPTPSAAASARRSPPASASGSRSSSSTPPTCSACRSTPPSPARPRPGSSATTCAAACPPCSTPRSTSSTSPTSPTGHLLAADKGNPGERYILGGHNRPWAELIDMVAHASGLHHPLLVVPAEAAHVARLREKLGLPGAISAEAFGLMGQDWRFTSAKAKRELGYRPRPLAQTVTATVEWYLELIEQRRLRRLRQLAAVDRRRGDRRRRPVRALVAAASRLRGCFAEGCSLAAEEVIRWRCRTRRDSAPPRCSARRSARTSTAPSRRTRDRDALVVAPPGRALHLPRARRRGRPRRARARSRLGLSKGDRVGIWAPNCAEWVVVQFATAKLGAILVNINPAYRTHELAYALRPVRLPAARRRAGVQDLATTRRWSTRSAPTCRDARARRLPRAPDWDDLLAAARDADVELARELDRRSTTRSTSSTRAARPASPRARRSRTTTSSTTATSSASAAATPRTTASASRCRSTTASAWSWATSAAITHGACMVIPAPAFEPAATLAAVAERALHGALRRADDVHRRARAPDFADFDLSSLRTGIMAGSPCPVEVMRKVDRPHAHGGA